MGEDTPQATVRKGTVQHLEDALEADTIAEKDFDMKQALQLLDVESTTT